MLLSVIISWIWDVQFRRNIQDWELDNVLDLFGRLKNFTIDGQSMDGMRWGNSGGGRYSVKAGYHKMWSQNEDIISSDGS